MAYLKSLEIDPRVNYPLLIAEIDNDSANLLLGYIPQGLASTGLSQCNEHWLKYCNNIIQPRYELTAPNRYNGTASQATIKLYDLDNAIYMAIVQAITDIRTKILTAIGPTIRTEMEDPGTGTIRKSLLEIMQFLYDNYGTPTEADLAIIHQSIAEPFPSDNLVYAGAIRQQKLFGQLSAMGQPESQHQKMMKFEAALSGLPSPLAALSRLFLLVNAVSSQCTPTSVPITPTMQLQCLLQDTSMLPSLLHLQQMHPSILPS